MGLLSAAILSIALGSSGFVSAQTLREDVNITLCTWNKLRVGVIRDTIYLDGGKRWWVRGRSDGTYSGAEADDYKHGDLFTLSLSTPFDTEHTNLTGLFGRLSPVNGGANNIAPNYVDGTIFTNDNELILYGGIILQTDASSGPSENGLLSYEKYFAGPRGATNWEQGFLQISVNNNVTSRYITHGAGVSVHSENRGYYFSGMRGEAWGEISEPQPFANYSANTLISVDMSEWREEKWTNHTLPRSVPPRAKSELAWIPVSDQGVLIAIGGVPHPHDIVGTTRPTPDQQRANSLRGAEFMVTVPVYDIASNKWYMQNTTGDIPPARSDFCSVVASAKDSSSYNIYIYGGYGGSDRAEISSDEVYILSVPSFTWIKAPQGRKEHGRRGHKCVKVLPNQMFVLGGLFLGQPDCLDGGIIQVFNLNTVEFQNTYDPTKIEEYKVPSIVRQLIGGDADGNAKMTKPSEWGDDELEAIFAKKYSKPIKTYYPYTSTVTSTPTSAPSGGGGGLPKWVGPVIGVVLGLILVTGLVVAWLLWRRRKDQRYAPSVGATSDNRTRVMRWIYGTGAPSGKNIDATTTTATDPGFAEKHMSSTYSEVGRDSIFRPHSRSAVVYSDLNEAASSPVHELQDSSNPNHPPLAATIMAPLELPTEYNESPVSSRTRFPSDAGSFLSPVSPGPISPPVSPPPEFPLTRPTHNRHNSSLSSTGFPTSLNYAVANDQPEQATTSAVPENTTNPVINEEENLQRSRFVSGITEDFSDDSDSHHEGEPEFKTW